MKILKLASKEVAGPFDPCGGPFVVLKIFGKELKILDFLEMLKISENLEICGK